MMFLSADDLVELTGYVQPLKKMGIPHRIRPDGRPIVTWTGVDGQKNQTVEPDFAAMRDAG